MAPTWVVGATVNLLGSILINLGTNLMKLGHNKSLALEEFERNNAPASPSSSTVPSPPPSSLGAGGKGPSAVLAAKLRRQRASKPRPARSFREWQAGIALFALGNVFNFVSFGFAAQSLLAALGSVQFVSNVVFARLVLKEAVTWRVLCATALIVTGCVLLVTFGNHGSELLSAKQLMKAYTNPAYIAYLVLAVVGVAVAYCLYRHGKAASLDPRRTAAARSRWSRSLPVSYALFSGLLGTQSVLFCKALSTLLRTTLHGSSQLGSWFFWTSLLALIVTALFWVSRLNKGLRLFPAVVIVPTMQISWTLFSIVSGMVYYQEYRSFSTLSAVMFALGVAVVFVGVWLLTPAVVPSSSPPSARAAAAAANGAAASEAKEGRGDGGGEAAAARAEDDGSGGAPSASAVVPVFDDDGISVEPLVTSGDEEEDEETGGRGVRSDDDDGERARRRRRRQRRDEPSTAAATAASSLDGGWGGSPVAAAAGVPPLELGGVAAAAAEAAGAGRGTPRSPFANEHWRQQRAAAAAAAGAPAAAAGHSPPQQWGRAQLQQQQALSPASSAGAGSHSSAPAAAAAGSSPPRWEDVALGGGAGGEGAGPWGRGSGSGASASAPRPSAAAAPASSSSLSRVRRRTCNSLMGDLADDFSVDAPSSLRPLLGLGPPGGAMAAVSLFSVPYEGLLPRGGGGAVGGGGGGGGGGGAGSAAASVASHDDDPCLPASNNAGSCGPRLAPSSKQHRPLRREQQQRQQQLQNRWSAPGDVESAGAAAAAREQRGGSAAVPAARSGNTGLRITEGLEEEEENANEAPPSPPPLSARASAAASALARPVAAAAARVARGVAAGAARVASPASDRPRPPSEEEADGDAEARDLSAALPPAALTSVELPRVRR